MRRLILIAVLLLVPIAASAENTIEIEYSFDGSALPDKTWTGMRLYMDNAAVCESVDIADDRFDCTFAATSGGHMFEMEALYSDGTASPKSPQFPFWFNNIHGKKRGLWRFGGNINRVIVTD